MEHGSNPTEIGEKLAVEAVLTGTTQVENGKVRVNLQLISVRNFACVELYTTHNQVKIYTKVDPATIQLKEGLTRDVTNIGHYGTGDLEINIRSKRSKRELDFLNLR